MKSAPRLLLLAAAAAALLAGPAAAGNSAAAASGRPAPDFNLASLGKDGRVQLKSLAGKVVLLDFWASWCSPCRRTLPELERMGARHPGLVVLAVSVDEDRAKAVQFLKDQESSLMAVHDSKREVADAYGLQGMPTGFLIDRRGVLRYRHDGYGESDFKQLDDEVRKLMEEKP
jgi:DsbE subfamily thiol:disulfide oxidoreductase